jgi:2-C-methyl-D-erythritol 2,4-cyclodiphosphate synthase
VPMRVGFGYDSHRFVEGRPLLLGGVRIESNRGLSGHSDADAVLHAVTDAILGALAAGDIGELFPDTDPAWAGADSRRFLAEALRLARGRSWRIANCDVTVVTEAPKLSAHKATIRASLAQLLGLNMECISLKAKTAEGMGPIGRGEGLEAIAVVLLEPAEP